MWKTEEKGVEGRKMEDVVHEKQSNIKDEEIEIEGLKASETPFVKTVELTHPEKMEDIVLGLAVTNLVTTGAA